METPAILDPFSSQYIDLNAYITTGSNKWALFDFNDHLATNLYKAFPEVNSTDPSHIYHPSCMYGGRSYQSYCFDSNFKWSKVDVLYQYRKDISNNPVNGYTKVKGAQAHVKVVVSEGGFNPCIDNIRSNGNHLCGRTGFMQYFIYQQNGPFNPSSVQYSK